MSEPRARSPIAADHRSALPSVPGIPWWGAVVLAMTLAAVGFAFDAGSGAKSLTLAFAFCYAAGCVLAVLAVRQSGVFTAVIQPPLVLFFTVPAAYFVLTGGQINGIKDLIINCGYPLIERFPLMFFTSGIVLLIGMVRWFLGASSRRAEVDAADIANAPEAAADGRLAAAAMSAMPAAETPRRSRRNSTSQAARAADAEAEEPRRKPKSPTSASRSRHNRPPDTELVEPPEHRPRRPRPAPPIDDAVEPRRRTRGTPPPDARRDPYERPERIGRVEGIGRADRSARADRTSRPERSERHERPERPDRPDRPDRPERTGRSGRPERSERSDRSERPERSERPTRGDRPERPDRPERRRRPTDSDPYDGRSTGATGGRNGSNGTHHPVSRVRYRTDDSEAASEERSRPRRPRDLEPDPRDYGR